MAQIGLMIEGQLGLTWERWRRILQAAESLGFQSVFRSDHFTTGLTNEESLETWVSLTDAASQTQRIEFGVLVSPITFRHPSMTVRLAAAVDDLSNGRLVYGMGAGWNEREHQQFGVPFYDFPTRFGMLKDALEITTRLLKSDSLVTYSGKYYSLHEAILLPRPKRPGGPSIMIGGKGPKRSLPFAAKYADEWNAAFISPADFKERNALLDDLVRQEGRDPARVKRSMMTLTIFCADEATKRAKLAEITDLADNLQDRNRIVGTASEIVDHIGMYVEAGVQRFMLQWLDLEDLDGIEKMANAVLPHFHK
jgi:F420-dependent oxidoreductase-like protein